VVKQVKDMLIAHYCCKHRGKSRAKIRGAFMNFLGVIGGNGLYDTEKTKVFLTVRDFVTALGPLARLSKLFPPRADDAGAHHRIPPLC